MSDVLKIKEAIRRLGAANKYDLLTGVCRNVDEAELVMDVVPDLDEDAVIHNVRLRAITDVVDGCVIIPEEESDVIIGSIYGTGYYCLIQASKVKKVIVKMGNADVLVMNDEITAKVGDTVHKMTASAHQIDTGNESMKQLLTDLIDEIKLITVTTSAGPSGTPINSPQLDAIKQRIPNLLS